MVLQPPINLSPVNAVPGMASSDLHGFPNYSISDIQIDVSWICKSSPHLFGQWSSVEFMQTDNLKGKLGEENQIHLILTYVHGICQEAYVHSMHGVKLQSSLFRCQIWEDSLEVILIKNLRNRTLQGFVLSHLVFRLIFLWVIFLEYNMKLVP